MTRPVNPGYGTLSVILTTEATTTVHINSHIQSNILNGLACHAHQCHAVTHHTTGKQFEYRDLIKDPFYIQTWLASGAIKLGRLAQGLPSYNVKGTDTIFFINKYQVPNGRTVTYVHLPS